MRSDLRRQWREDNKILQSQHLKPVTFQDWFELKLIADSLTEETEN